MDFDFMLYTPIIQKHYTASFCTPVRNCSLPDHTIPAFPKLNVALFVLITVGLNPLLMVLWLGGNFFPTCTVVLLFPSTPLLLTRDAEGDALNLACNEKICGFKFFEPPNNARPSILSFVERLSSFWRLLFSVQGRVCFGGGGGGGGGGGAP